MPSTRVVSKNGCHSEGAHGVPPQSSPTQPKDMASQNGFNGATALRFIAASAAIYRSINGFCAPSSCAHRRRAYVLTAAYRHPACASVRYRKTLVPYRSKKIARRTAPQQANSQRFECDAQVTILSLLRCGIARLTMNSKSPRCVSHPLQPKVCEPASLVAPSQIRPRIGDALRRQELDAIPSTDKAAESWAAFFRFCVFLLFVPASLRVHAMATALSTSPVTGFT